MDESIERFRFFLVLFLALVTTSLKSQEIFHDELKWIPYDSISKTILQDTNQIIDWSMDLNAPQFSLITENISLCGNNIFIIMVDICSGIYCPFISVFKKEENCWHLITSTHANLSEQLDIIVDKQNEKIVFRTKSKQVGELSNLHLNVQCY